MNEIILKSLRLSNYSRSNENVVAEVEFMLPNLVGFSTESTLSLKLTEEQTRRIVAAAAGAIKDACVERLTSVRNDMLLLLDEQPALPEAPSEPGPAPLDHVLYPPATPSVGDEPAALPAEDEPAPAAE